MAQAKRKNTTKPSRHPARQNASQIHKPALGRMEQIIATLESRVVVDGWHESWESGPMPKRAADVMAYLRARAAGARENAAKEAKMLAFIADCGQSIDWIFDGDVGGMICKAAGNSPQSAGLQSIAARSNVGLISEKAQEIAGQISDLENSVRVARNLAMAIRMLGSSDDMPRGPGAALDTVADMLVEKLEALEKTRERVWRQALAA
jgi:hypothetical protein